MGYPLFPKLRHFSMPSPCLVKLKHKLAQTMSVHCSVKRALEMRVRERCLCVIAIFSICFWCSITTRVPGHSASVMSDTDPGAANPIPGVIPCPDPFLQDFVISVISCQARAQHSTLSKSDNFRDETEP